ncbi:hypothetical protein CJ030_MR6G010462 [Morella rubra]|uniref:ENT domain-containing protein n=1 Tax=Morella rubra TaxID=262757 RepID=A0A6A1V8L3_9ROSI|nr:hypothetical protein CJ030_MR6G010462 [Morella rubra]
MRFKKGSKVEVLSKKEVPSGSWHCAEIVCGNGHNYTVRYDGYGPANGETVVERVPRKAIRPCPPTLDILDNWVPGDVVEVFDNFAWKMATVTKVLAENYFLVRLLGSSMEFQVFEFDIRVRQSWQDGRWVLVGKGSGNFEDGKRDDNSNLKCKLNLSSNIRHQNTRINIRVNDACFPVINSGNFQESRVVSSKTMKRGSPYCYSQLEVFGVAPKSRAIEKEGKCHRVKAANLSTCPTQVDVVTFPRNMLGENFINASSKRTTGISEVEAERRKPTGTVGCSLANLEPNYINSVTCSVGSCSITGNSSYKWPCDVSAGCFDDDDGHSSDAESFCPRGYEEGNSLLPSKEEIAAEIHRLELHAYRCTIEALHASGPLSWEQEEMVTNLRLSLHISNDEHLIQLRNLGSVDTSIPIR